MATNKKIMCAIQNYLHAAEEANIDDETVRSLRNCYDEYFSFSDNYFDTKEVTKTLFKFLFKFRKTREFYIYEIFAKDFLEGRMASEVEIAELIYLMCGDLYTTQSGMKFVYNGNEWVKENNFHSFILKHTQELLDLRVKYIKEYEKQLRADLKTSKNTVENKEDSDSDSDDDSELKEKEKQKHQQYEKEKKKIKNLITGLEKEVITFQQKITSLASLKNINSLISDTFCPKKDILFNIDPIYYNQLHFKNGYLDLTNRHFYKRTADHLITEYLPYNYTEEYDKDKFNDINSFFKKIQPNKEQRRFCTRMLRYCLFGGNKEKVMLMNIGYSAANGKSTTLKIHEKVFPIYTRSLDQNTFSENCSKRHKYLSDLIRGPVRLCYVEELSKDKLDVDFVKKFVDADMLDLEQLFTTEINQTKIQCKLITTSNRDPNSSMDEGLSRRIVVQHYNSQFVRPDLVDVENHKYPIDLHYIDKFNEHEYKIAYLHYILNAGELDIPTENRSITRELLEENDEFKCQFDKHFIITQNSKDKIYKTDVSDMFCSTQWNTLSKVNKELKRFNVKLNQSKFIGDRRGCFEGIKKFEDPDEVG